MDLYYSTTSPYARLVRVALREKGLDGRVTPHLVDPWADDAELMRANPLVRVPALVTDDGQALTESLVIALYLETAHPEPALVPTGQRAAVLARAGVAMGAVDAAVHTLIGRRIAGPDFDSSPVGLRRRRGMEQALDRLEHDPPASPARRSTSAPSPWPSSSTTCRSASRTSVGSRAARGWRRGTKPCAAAPRWPRRCRGPDRT